MKSLEGPSDVQLICREAPSACDWEDMGNSKGKAEEPSKDDAKDGPESSNRHEGIAKLYAPIKNIRRRPCCRPCLKILFILLSIVNILMAVVLIAVAASTAIGLKIYSNEVSGRMVAMIILAVTAAVTLTVSIYASIAVISDKKNVHCQTTIIVLLILAVIQAVIVGVSVRVTPEDEMSLSRSLTESFRLAQQDNPRHVKIWATTQSDLNCCGVYSPDDFRSPKIPEYFAPDVPISCCPSYDPNRSELVQEREREMCKAKKEFYEVGCRDLILEVFKDSSTILMAVTISSIFLMIKTAIVGAILCSQNRRMWEAEEAAEANNSNNNNKTKP